MAGQYEPAGQITGLLAGSGQYEPEGQGDCWESPSCEHKEPKSHFTGVPLLAGQYEPAGQITGLLAGSGQYEPEGQSLQLDWPRPL